MWGQKGYAFVNGIKVPYAGNVCMDQAMLDVTDVPDVKVGDEILVLGTDGTNTVTVEDIAKATGRLHHEIITASDLRLPKMYKETGDDGVTRIFL